MLPASFVIARKRFSFEQGLCQVRGSHKNKTGCHFSFNSNILLASHLYVPLGSAGELRRCANSYHAPWKLISECGNNLHGFPSAVHAHFFLRIGTSSVIRPTHKAEAEAFDPRGVASPSKPPCPPRWMRGSLFAPGRFYDPPRTFSRSRSAAPECGRNKRIAFFLDLNACLPGPNAMPAPAFHVLFSRFPESADEPTASMAFDVSGCAECSTYIERHSE